VRHTRSVTTSDHRACARAHAPRTVVRSKGLWRALGQGRSPSRATLPPWGCQWPPMSAFDQIDRPWLFAGFQFCATTDASIPPVCGAMFRTTWQRLQSKVCDVDSPLNLTRKGEPQKGQRGCEASLSMPLTLDSESLINGKKASYVGQNAGASPSLPGPYGSAASRTAVTWATESQFRRR
jgi:hypothetical protein